MIVSKKNAGPFMRESEEEHIAFINKIKEEIKKNNLATRIKKVEELGMLSVKESRLLDKLTFGKEKITKKELYFVLETRYPNKFFPNERVIIESIYFERGIGFKVGYSSREKEFKKSIDEIKDLSTEDVVALLKKLSSTNKYITRKEVACLIVEYRMRIKKRNKKA